MNKFWSILFLFLINCTVSTAQSFHFKGLDLDTGANMVNKVYFNKQMKSIVLASSSILWHKVDSYNRYILKPNFSFLDSNSNLITNNTFSLNNEYYRLKGTIKLTQGGYLSYGYKYNSRLLAQGNSSVPGCLIRFTDFGDTLFTKSYPYRQDNSSIRAIRQLMNNNIILISLVTDTLYTYTALRIIKLNYNFNVLYDSIYYYSNTSNVSEPRIMSFLDAVEESDDGGLIIGTSILTRNESIENHALIFKTDSNGKIVWERRFEFAADRETQVNKILKLNDGNYIAIGYYRDFYYLNQNVDSYIFLTKFTNSGVILSKKLVNYLSNHFIYDAVEKSNGDMLLVGTMSGLNSLQKATFFLLNNNGNIKWVRQFAMPNLGGNIEFNSSNLSNVEIARDGTIMAVGDLFVIDSVYPYNNGGNQDLIFLYTDSNGCVDPSNCTFTTVEEEPVMPLYFQVYPNPSRGKINFSTNINTATSAYIKIYNNLGQLLFEKAITNFTEEVDVSTLSRGMYILELESKEFRNTKKLLIE